VSGSDLRWCHRFKIEQGKTERRCHKRRLQVNRQQDAEPYRVKAEFDHNRGKNRNMDKCNFDKIEKKADNKNKSHDNGQNHSM